MSEALAEEVFREASETIEVHPPSLDDVRRRAREERRRSWSRAGRWSLAAVLLVGVVTWVATRPEPAREPELTVAPTTRVENPVDQVWFANGELHLDHVVVQLPPLRDLVGVSGGAVYAADDGVVVFVADDGARTRLGTKEPGTPLVASDEQGWVSWSDTGGREPVLVLYDLTSRQRLRTITPPDPEHGSATPLRPVAIDQDRLYFASAHESFSVTADGAPELVEGQLLDVSSATRVFQDDPESIRMEQSFFSTVTTALGVGAQLSPDGDHVLTRTGDGVSSYGTVRVYDTRSGDEVATGLTAEDVAVAAAFARDGSVTYVIARAEDRPSADRFVRQSFSGALELRSCAVGGTDCAVLAKFPSTGSMALLAD